MSTVREEYCAKVKIQIDALNAKVDALEARLQETNENIRSDCRAELNQLRQQSERMSTQLAQIKTNGEASWDKLVQDMDEVRDAFMQSLNDFKSLH
jgi:chromosome segregation ATPase